MDVAIDAEQLTTYLRQKHAEHVFSIGQLLVHDFQSYRLQFKVLKFELFSVDELAALNVPIPSEFGDKARYVVVNSSTFFAYTRPNDSAVKLKNLPGGCVSWRPRSAVAAVGPDRLPPLGPRGTAWGGRANMNAPIAPDFNFAELGIGGLDDEFQTIFRRAFASRVLPMEIFKEFGVRHVKGP